MLKRLILILALIGAMASPASAQWVKDDKPTPKNAKEYFAQRALSDASYITQGDGTAVVIEADLEYTLKRLDDAFTTYKTLCEDRALPTDQWSRNCFELANLHRRGLGTNQDQQMANRLYEMICFEADHADGCMQLAYAQQRGTPIRNRPAKPKPEEARKTYEHACDLGHAPACAGLGNMLYAGIGGDQDRRRGATLMDDACQDGYEWACTRLNEYGPLVRTDRY
jgi:TPR repeat protein